jgi:hypothetical protein
MSLLMFQQVPPLHVCRGIPFRHVDSCQDLLHRSPELKVARFDRSLLRSLACEAFVRARVAILVVARQVAVAAATRRVVRVPASAGVGGGVGGRGFALVPFPNSGSGSSCSPRHRMPYNSGHGNVNHTCLDNVAWQALLATP